MNTNQHACFTTFSDFYGEKYFLNPSKTQIIFVMNNLLQIQIYYQFFMYTYIMWFKSTKT